MHVLQLDAELPGKGDSGLAGEPSKHCGAAPLKLSFPLIGCEFFLDFQISPIPFPLRGK
jgi:hypothetical protein